ncbi:MAG: outer membrane protein assembly factor BamD [Bacteroidales bacterium]|jgi:outer membrane protein assembly factor BamD|nr:outer membrane protein assembly factor BamD [Bacteroidales bacterium]MDD3299557.1 outer membrane protein assembly factor BamD [Bacteroidales bacterium]MDD3843897.1 outer membrane protein assembly factor BamD [Bacteroidales bacterium]MDD4618165.1 outer membrane protein assembly factor BamD [Bacteroidales bacterium]
MMKYIKIVILALVMAVAAVSCKSQFDLLMQSNDTDKLYKGAFEYFENKKFLKASDLFDKLLLSVKGTERDDTVQFYLGLSNYNYGDYTIAEANFDQFIAVFPRSPFTEEAKYLRVECMYKSTYRYELDQTPTYKTMSAINEFLYEYPNSQYLKRMRDMLVDLQERLDRKSFESAKLYYTIEDYKAAAYALKNVLKENSDNQYREEVLYYIVASNHQYATNSVKEKQRERFLTLVDEYYNFISEYPESKYRKEVDKMFEQAQQYIKNK